MNRSKTAILAMAAIATLAGPALTASAADQSASGTASTVCPRAQMMYGQMQRMQAMHHAMMQAKTPEQRAKLMGDQMKLMREGMDGMRGMSGAGMSGGKRMMGGGMGGGKGMMSGGMGAGAGMRGGGGPGACMSERMDMMQMMMQMMMDRMEAGPSAK